MLCQTKQNRTNKQKPPKNKTNNLSTQLRKTEKASEQKAEGSGESRKDGIMHLQTDGSYSRGDLTRPEPEKMEYDMYQVYIYVCHNVNISEYQIQNTELIPTIQ